MVESEPQHLRVLIANEKRDRLELLAEVVTGLGHDVIAREITSRKSAPRPRENGQTWPLSGSDSAPSTRSS
jgi:hypothetical protein